jgi:hypothetical protein
MDPNGRISAADLSLELQKLPRKASLTTVPEVAATAVPDSAQTHAIAPVSAPRHQRPLFPPPRTSTSTKTQSPSAATLYSIVFVDSNPATLARAQLYYRDVEFASQLCSEFADAERSDAELYSRLSQAHDALQLIVDHNPLLRSLPSERQPAWPRHEALLRFDLPLQRLTTQYKFTKKWIPRFFILRGSRLYYSNGKSGHADSLEGSLAFMRSNPAPDGHCCRDLKGACARCMTAVFCCAS